MICTVAAVRRLGSRSYLRFPFVLRSLLAYWRGSSPDIDSAGSGGDSNSSHGCFMHFDSCAPANDSAANATADVLWRALFVDPGATASDDGSGSGESSGQVGTHNAAETSVQLPPRPVVQSAAEWMPRQRNGVRILLYITHVIPSLTSTLFLKRYAALSCSRWIVASTHSARPKLTSQRLVSPFNSCRKRQEKPQLQPTVKSQVR